VDQSVLAVHLLVVLSLVQRHHHVAQLSAAHGAQLALEIGVYIQEVEGDHLAAAVIGLRTCHEALGTVFLGVFLEVYELNQTPAERALRLAERTVVSHMCCEVLDSAHRTAVQRAGNQLGQLPLLRGAVYPRLNALTRRVEQTINLRETVLQFDIRLNGVSGLNIV
jgi:hypothetical protein